MPGESELGFGGAAVVDGAPERLEFRVVSSFGGGGISGEDGGAMGDPGIV